MQTLHQAFNKIVQLVSLVPGVLVESSSLAGRVATINLVLRGESSLKLLRHVSCGANVALTPQHGNGNLFREPVSFPVQVRITAGSLRRDRFRFGELQMLGVWLVWELHSLRLLSTASANRLLTVWGGAANLAPNSSLKRTNQSLRD